MMTMAPVPRSRWWAPTLALALTLVALLTWSEVAAPAVAATPLGSAPSAEIAVHDTTLLERASAWLLQTQRDLHRKLTQGLHQLDEAPTVSTATALIVVSFLYGIFHAAGPGHGKAVISTYLLTHPHTLLRGIALSTAASLLQGLTAIVAVLVLIGVLGWLARDAMGQVRNLELASFLLVALLGLWLVLRSLRSFLRTWQSGRRAALPDALPQFRRVASATQGDAPGVLGPGHRHPPGCGCGSPHHVDPTLRGPWYAAVLAVGIRPCSGAVLVMAVSYLLGIWAAGIAAVLAMSLGTAITVSLLAFLAVRARDWVRRMVQPGQGSRFVYAGSAVGLVGGLVIFWMGWTLFQGTLMIEPVRHPLGL